MRIGWCLVDYEAIAGLPAAIPFVRLLDLEYLELGPLRHRASAGAAELVTTSTTARRGAVHRRRGRQRGAFVAGFAERLGEITPLAKSASIDYEKLAKGPIDATASLDGVDGLLQTLDSDGKVEFPIEVTMRNSGGQQVATATVEWHVRKN